MAYEKVDGWIKEGRLEILTPKSTAESLSTAIIERCIAFQKEEPNDQEQQIKQEQSKIIILFVNYFTFSLV